MKTLTAIQRRACIGVFAVVVTWVTFSLIGGPFRFASVCNQCGAIRYTTQWKSELPEFTVFASSTEFDSQLSRVLLTNGIVQPHPHHWLFAQGGGNGVRCAIGPGRHIRPAVESEEFAGFVLMLHRQGQFALRDRVLRAAFDPRSSFLVRGLDFSAPNPAIGDPEIRRRIEDQIELLDEAVAGR